MTKSSIFVLTTVLVGIAAFVMVWCMQSGRKLDHVNLNSSVPTTTVPDNASSGGVPSAGKTPIDQSLATNQVPIESDAEAFRVDVETDFHSIFAGEIGISVFIRHHEDLAQNGNADSMHYLAQAIKDCIVSMTMVQPVIDKIALERGEIAEYREGYREIARQEGVVYSEFAKQEWSNRIDRAYDCFSLGKNVATLDSESDMWEALAVERGQSNAVAASVTSELQNKTAEELQHAKSVIRDVLVSQKTLETILAAEALSSFVTGRNGTTERVAWALLACEYYDCESRLSYRYRTTCEIDATYGNTYCTPGMTDYEFLRAKLPEHFDIAGGRAMDLKQAIDSEQWDRLGL